MNLRRFLFGRPLRSDAEAEEQIGTAEGIPVLGLDALASASYGPEAALTVLIVSGAAASQHIVPVSAAIIVLLLAVYFSYRQTIAAYPNGGGSFTVAKENLGPTAGLVAAAALAVDYVLKAAVAVSAEGPLDVRGLSAPIVVIPLRRLDQVGEKALRFALTIADEVHVVQVLDTEDLKSQWRDRIEEPVRAQLHREPPKLVVIRSAYRQFFERFLTWLRDLMAERPDRQIIVLIPELVQRRWYQFVVNHRAVRLRAQLLLRGGPHVSVMSTPWYADLTPTEALTRWRLWRLRSAGAEEPD